MQPIANPEFSGEFICTVDDKYRLKLPEKLKEGLKEEHGLQLTLIRYFNRKDCLILKPTKNWEFERNKLWNDLDRNNPKHLKFYDLKTSGASDISLDAAARVQIPKALVLTFDNEKELVVRGLGDHIQIWGVKQWNKYNEIELASLSDEDLVSIAQEIGNR